MEFRRLHQESLHDILSTSAERNPTGAFLDCQDGTISYAAFVARVARLARGLTELQVSGRMVLSVLDNGIDTVCAWYAANLAGATYVPVNTGLRGGWLAKQLHSIDPAVILAQEHYVERLLPVTGELTGLRALVSPGGHRPSGLVAAVGHHDLAELESMGELEPPRRPGAEDLSAITFTSGTTAASKACTLSHGYIANMARHILAFTERTADEICWTSLPLFHLNAMSSVVATSMLGSTLSVSPTFSVSRFWHDVERSQAKIIQLLGSMPVLLANSEPSEAEARCRGQVRLAVGAPINPELAERLRARFGIHQIANQSYGMTEACCLTYATCSDPAPPGSVGRATPDFDVRIVDEHDDEVPAGTPGQIVCRPTRPNVMFSGYWNAPGESMAKLSNLWWHTGDYGRFDEDGYLYFVERAKDTVRRRGENIATLEVEEVFSLHPDVHEAAAHGVSSDLGDDDLKLSVIPKAGRRIDPGELLIWGAAKLPYFAVPRYVEFRADLPRNELGRVLKRELRSQGVTPDTWDREAAGLVIDRA